MAGTVASESILLIAAIIVTTAFVGVFAGVVQDLSAGVENNGERVSSELRTHITIINDPQQITTSPDPVVYVKNTGDTALFTQFIEVLVDGQFSNDTTMDVLPSGDETILRPGDVLEITVNDLEIGTGDHRIRVVTEHGVAATLDFTV